MGYCSSRIGWASVGRWTAVALCITFCTYAIILSFLSYYQPMSFTMGFVFFL